MASFCPKVKDKVGTAPGSASESGTASASVSSESSDGVPDLTQLASPPASYRSAV